jgi:hypoxanthine-guanine phosphoribosyltransferase
MKDNVSVLFSEEQIARRVAEVGEEIARGFQGARSACSA